MKEIVVGVGDCQTSRDPESIIATYALGSCIGVTAYDPTHRVGGLLHAMLPDSRIHGQNVERPAMFVNTGMLELCNKLKTMGADPLHCEWKIFGGAQVMQADSYFRIGEKNVYSFTHLAEQWRLRVSTWEVQGQHNRTIKLHLGTGKVWLKMPNQEITWR